MSANAIERLSRYVGESWDETMGRHWHDWNEARRDVAAVEALLEAAPDHDCRLRLNRSEKRVYCALCDAISRVETGQ